MIFEEDEDKNAGGDDMEKDFTDSEVLDDELFDDEPLIDELDADLLADEKDEEEEIASDTDVI
jgi:hypothetical protein